MKTQKIKTTRPFTAITEACLREPYSRLRLVRDTIAGITVGIIAIPLAMALAIASGVPPQYGLYTSVVAGLVIALTGGSRFSVSGPTAAFVVILYPVSQQFGLGGLLVATMFSGLFLMLMGITRLGRLIEYIPLPVTLGFTSGIAVTIATMQVKDFLGLQTGHMPEHYAGRVVTLIQALPSAHLADALTGGVTLLILIYWPRLRVRVPGHLPALIAGTGVMALLSLAGYQAVTIGSSFSWLLPDGSHGQGIPDVLPQLQLPWQLPGPGDQPFTLDGQTLSALLPAALSMAMLGAIESLLCAVVLDGMTGKKHRASEELLGQGLGNMVAPFFGGITATAAIARSAANVRAGATSPVAAIIHSLVVLVALLLLAPVLSFLPLASMAALLFVVAWNMSEARKVVDLLRRAPRDDIIVMLLCLSLTVFTDMVVAISAGIVLASLLFMRRIAGMTRLSTIRNEGNALVLRVNGPLFFAAADRIFGELQVQGEAYRTLILQWDAVPVLDAGGLSALQRFINGMADGQQLIITDIPFQPLKTLARAGVQPEPGRLAFMPSLDSALSALDTGEVSDKEGTLPVVPGSPLTGH